MSDPIQQLKRLPWRSLLQATVLTGLVVIVLDVLMPLVMQSSAATRNLFGLLFAPPMGLLTIVAIAIGVGAIAVVFLERLYRPAITSGSLWGLILCLMMVFFAIRSLVPPQAVLIQVDHLRLMGFIVGVFWKGRPYWQSFRRW